MSNSDELVVFLNKYVTKVPPYTHTSYIGNKYNIPEKDLLVFYQLYYKALKANKPLYLIERTLDEFNYFQDLDMKGLKNLDPSDIKEIVLGTLELLELEGEFNYVVSRRDTNYHITYEKRVTQLEAAELTNRLKSILSDDLSIVLDTSVYKNNGLRMLGSRTNKSTDVYRLYDLDEEEYIKKVNFDIFKRVLLNGKFLKDTKQKDKKAKNEKMNDQIGEDIAKLMIDLKSNELLRERIKDIEKLTKFDLTCKRVTASKSKFTGLMNFYVVIADRFCPFKHREHKRDSNPIYLALTENGLTLRCYDVECVNKCYPNDLIKLPLDWPEFSRLYPILTKYLTVKYYTAEVEMTSETRELITKSLSGTHYSIAKVLFHLYKDIFRMDEMKNTEWYYFNGIRWEKTYKLHIYISEELPKYYRSLRIRTNREDQDEAMEEETMEDKIRYNALIDKCIVKFESSPFKKGVFEELKYLYYDLDSKFASRLDANPYLVGFENGVYDLKGREFREAKLEDYITYSTNYSYIPYDKDNAVIKDIYKFLKEIIPNDAVRVYTLKVLGRMLLGIPDEKFYMWTGLEGSNGKSTLINLLERTLGDYAIACDTSLLTNKRAGSSSATPDLFEMRGKRGVFFQEPENSDRLRTGVMKQLTGGDTIKARELFKSLVSFKSQGSFIMCCNELPAITAQNDGGSWRRIRIVKFNSRFCEFPKKSHEYKIDPDLKEKMKEWPAYFMSILIHYYLLFLEEGNLEPREVMVATNSYKRDNNDKFEEYILQSLDISNEVFTPVKEICEDFINWWTNEYPTVKLPSVLDLKKSLKGRFGEVIEGRKNGKDVKGYNIGLKNDNSFLLDE